jgi:hypothetical protein
MNEINAHLQTNAAPSLVSGNDSDPLEEEDPDIEEDDIQKMASELPCSSSSKRQKVAR